MRDEQSIKEVLQRLTEEKKIIVEDKRIKKLDFRWAYRNDLDAQIQALEWVLGKTKNLVLKEIETARLVDNIV